MLMPRVRILFRRLPRVMPEDAGGLELVAVGVLQHADEHLALHPLQASAYRFSLPAAIRPPTNSSQSNAPARSRVRRSACGGRGVPDVRREEVRQQHRPAHLQAATA